jgi:small GTP-binding protein
LAVFVRGVFPEVHSPFPTTAPAYLILLESWVPTVFESWVADGEVDDKRVELALWDTAGQEEYDQLRPLSYPGTDVLLICFAVDRHESFHNIQEKVGTWNRPCQN